MVFPFQQPRTNFPNPMQRSPNNFMFPQRSIARGAAGLPIRNNGVQGMLQRFIQPHSAGINIASKGAGGLTQTLNNVQQVLKAVQSTAPIIQEYGPMVKNLPAMYRMMKAFKDVGGMDSDTAKESVAKESQNEKGKVEEKEEKINVESKKISGQSTPKLYI